MPASGRVSILALQGRKQRLMIHSPCTTTFLSRISRFIPFSYRRNKMATISSGRPLTPFLNSWIPRSDLSLGATISFRIRVFGPRGALPIKMRYTFSLMPNIL
jgi:hypothetical protein